MAVLLKCRSSSLSLSGSEDRDRRKGAGLCTRARSGTRDPTPELSQLRYPILIPDTRAIGMGVSLRVYYPFLDDSSVEKAQRQVVSCQTNVQ
jgi:hypothetical protein